MISLLMGEKKEKSQNHVLILIDLENLIISVNNLNIQPERFSLEDGLNKEIENIAQKVGPIVGIYVFVPSHLASIWGEKLEKQGFFIIYCPKITTKKGDKEDTVDKELMRFGSKIINQIDSITHLCLGSGDQDFIPLLQEARQLGIKNMILTGSIGSLSRELIKFAEKDPETGKRRIYIFSSTE